MGAAASSYPRTLLEGKRHPSPISVRFGAGIDIQLCGVDPDVHHRRSGGFEGFVENATDVAIR